MPLRIRPDRRGATLSTFTPKLRRDVARPVGARAELGHREEIALLEICQAIHSDAEEVLVELILHVRLGRDHVVEADR